jgi:hypothetical protein
LFYIKSLGRFVGGTAFGGTEGGDEELFYFHTLCQDSLIGAVAALDEQFQPVFALCAFLQRNLKLGDKVCSAVRIEGFPDIGADTGTGAKELIGQHSLPTGSTDLIAEMDDGEGEGFRLVLKRAGHKEAPQIKDKRMEKNTSFLFTFTFSLTKNPEKQGRERKSE